MKKAESHHHGGGGGGGGEKNEMIGGGDDELLIRPFKKLKVSRLGKGSEEKSNNHWSVGKSIHSSPPSLGGHPSFRFRPSRLSSVQNSSPTTQDKEEPSTTWRRSNGATKDFSSLIIRRFDTISLSGGKRKKKRPEEEEPEGLLPEEDRTEKTVNCATQARQTYNDVSVDDLAGYLENSMVFPKKMSYMAEMMYT